jgi:16S rRNA (cytidine1402-2'-O)-methyltransferase
VTLIVAATPLGNPADASPRLAEALATADVIAAEDTRRLRRLAADLEVRPVGRVLSYYEQNERQRLPELLAALHDGATVLLVTDAGMPAVSDPGHRLVAAAVAEELPVTVLPGPSAVTTALAVSGLAVERFCFEGFPPRKPGQRDNFFAEIATEPRALVFFESPRRLADTLAAMAKAFGPERKAAVCRELTKIHEEVRRGGLGELADWAAEGVLGEVTVVVEGAPAGPGGPVDAATLAAEVAAREAAGTDRKTAIGEVARSLGVPRRQVYEAVVTSRRESR